MRWFYRFARFTTLSILAGSLVAGLAAIGAYYYLSPGLPSTEVLKDVRLQVPLRVYSADNRLIAEFGEMKRSPLRFGEIPPLLVSAIVAAEDDRFFQHPGVDYQGLLRAALHLLKTGEKEQGGSTITMQVARNFFLSREKTYLRKINEILLALKIERELPKEEILELYLNKIYLGHRAYGVAAAAQVYYGKPVDELTLAQYAMIAGLPKAPSTTNPVTDPKRALFRRNYVLRRMHTLGYITAAEFEEASATPITAAAHTQAAELDAPYLAEMVRAEMTDRYGRDAYTAGLRVYTTVDSKLQSAANKALRDGLLAYDRRHGYRGVEGHLTLEDEPTPEAWRQYLADYGNVGGLRPALVTAVEERGAALFIGSGETVRLEWEGLEWARPYIDDQRVGAQPKHAADILAIGDIVRIEETESGWRLAQLPRASGALVSLRPEDGALLAVVGGFDYFHSKFNRATLARRQPGSSFKPFIYSAALENGFTPASLINDAPVVFEDSALEATWRPENYSGQFYGPTRLREALVRSRNLVSIRILRAIGLDPALDHLSRFGFDRQRLPRDLSLSLGSGSITPWELVRGYAVFANGGYLIEPYFIQRIEDANGQTVFESDPAIACEPPCEEAVLPTSAANGDDRHSDITETSDHAPLSEAVEPGVNADGESTPDETLPHQPRLAPRTVTPQNAYLMTSMMRDVIRHGTGRQALRLGRGDLAGKTGTTNEQKDAWFSGFNGDAATSVWVGFDNARPLGAAETGARAALPIWIDFMKVALDGRPEHNPPQPPDIVTVRIDPETGLLAPADQPDAIYEIFLADTVPRRSAVTQRAVEGGPAPSAITEQLF